MVLVGHSMGGLLSSTAVRYSGNALADLVFKVPASEYEPRARQDEVFRDLLWFEPKPYIQRVVFMSVPHGGSSMSESFVGKLGQFLISPPKRLRDFFVRLKKNHGDILEDGIDHVASSVEMLSPANPILQAIRKLPMRDGLKFHSVIGQIEPGPKAEGTDGVVPYVSSHLDGAQSELIIRSDHSTELRAAAITEVRRILRLHLAERKGG